MLKGSPDPPDRCGESPHLVLPSGAHVTAGKQAEFCDKKRSELRQQHNRHVVFSSRGCLTTEIWPEVFMEPPNQFCPSLEPSHRVVMPT